MNFKEWLNLDEVRLKGLHRMFRNEHPDMPHYVQKDLYTSRIAHSFNKSLRPTSPNNSKPTASSPSDIMKLSGLKNITWAKKPTTLRGKWGQAVGVTPADFDEDTQWRMLDRRFGMREEKQIRNDMARTAKQKELMGVRGEGNEPVVVVQTNKGFKLLEGWHRTMNYLLQGAPPDQLQILRDGLLNDIDFVKWNPVKIQGYIGQDEGYRNSTAGTGSYTPSASSTGEYVPQMNFDIQKLAKSAGLNVSTFDPKQIMMGLNVEKEHDGAMGKDVDVVKKQGDLLKIVIAHLREDPQYYTKLKKVEGEE